MAPFERSGGRNGGVMAMRRSWGRAAGTRGGGVSSRRVKGWAPRVFLRVGGKPYLRYSEPLPLCWAAFGTTVRALDHAWKALHHAWKVVVSVGGQVLYMSGRKPQSRRRRAGAARGPGFLPACGRVTPGSKESWRPWLGDSPDAHDCGCADAESQHRGKAFRRDRTNGWMALVNADPACRGAKG